MTSALRRCFQGPKLRVFFHRLQYSRPNRTLDTSTIHLSWWAGVHHPAVHTKMGVWPPLQGRVSIAHGWRKPASTACSAVRYEGRDVVTRHMCSLCLLGSRLSAAGLLCISQEATHCSWDVVLKCFERHNLLDYLCLIHDPNDGCNDEKMLTLLVHFE